METILERKLNMKKAVALYSQTGSENRGFGIRYLNKVISEGGKPAYDYAVKELSNDKTVLSQISLLGHGQKYLDFKTAKCIIDSNIFIFPQTEYVEELAGVLFAKKWNIVRPIVLKTIDNVIKKKGDSVSNPKILGTGFGLAFLLNKKSESKTQFLEILEQIRNLDNGFIKNRLEKGINAALRLSKGKLIGLSNGKPVYKPYYNLEFTRNLPLKREELKHIVNKKEKI